MNRLKKKDFKSNFSSRILIVDFDYHMGDGVKVKKHNDCSIDGSTSEVFF